jgi:predicted Zn-dependent peptidase
LFPDHSIGRNILGTIESLGLFQNGLVETFRSENYSTEEIVLCSVGNIPFKKILTQLESLFQDHDLLTRSRKRIVPTATSGLTTMIERNTYQSHCVISGEAYSYTGKDRIGLHLLNNILGGPGMNSRLNMALREKRGYSYGAESHYLSYTDTGALNIYFSCDKPRLKKCLEITKNELSSLRKSPISSTRLTYSRRQLLGQIAIASENSENLMLNIAKSHLLFNKVDSLKDISEKLEAVDANKLRDIANELFDPSKLNTLIYK